MSITVAQVKSAVHHKMREYSNRGTLQTDTDYLLSVVPLINSFQRELATTIMGIKRTYDISQYNPDNMLGKYEWTENDFHTNEDREYEVTGAQGFSFQLGKGSATVYIKEETSTDVWVTLVTITRSATQIVVTEHLSPDVVTTTTLDGSEGFVTIKGLTHISSIANDIKFVLTGNYTYPFRWVAFFEYLYPTNADVPSFEPYVSYLLPTNYYRINRSECSMPEEVNSSYPLYKITKVENEVTYFYLDYYFRGEIVVNYYAYPAFITEPTTANITASDAVKLDIADEAVDALTYKIASILLKDENPYMADTFDNDFRDNVNILDANKEESVSFQTIPEVNGW